MLKMSYLNRKSLQELMKDKWIVSGQLYLKSKLQFYNFIKNSTNHISILTKTNMISLSLKFKNLRFYVTMLIKTIKMRIFGI